MDSSAVALDLGSQPVLLANANGWSNVMRFTSLAVAKLAELRRRAQLNSAGALGRLLLRIEQRLQREGLQKLRQRAKLEVLAVARSNAELMLRRLRGLVDSFELPVDDVAEDICRQVLDEDEEPTIVRALRLKS
ncbi:unnamed protein product [Polarella glacialis]|uniref:Uncharacterized protein n=1 Tax=Polarella glacialis TaxID=89957 RepID=A0A813ITV2_POLGL|nr:unnamed protein product [Polarella glacialis]